MQSKNQTAIVTAAGRGKQLNVLGHSITEILTTKNTDSDYYMFECVSPPGQGIPLHTHQHEDEIVAIVEGEFSVMVGNKRYHALNGDVCFFPRLVGHSIQNIGAKAGITLWTVIPGARFEIFFNKMGKLRAGEPNPITVAKIFADHGVKLLKPGTFNVK